MEATLRSDMDMDEHVLASKALAGQLHERSLMIYFEQNCQKEQIYCQSHRLEQAHGFKPYASTSN